MSARYSAQDHITLRDPTQPPQRRLVGIFKETVTLEVRLRPGIFMPHGKTRARERERKKL